MKGRSCKEWYEIRMQADGGLWRIVGHNTDKHKDANHFNNIGEKISVDVKRSLADNSLFFGDWCLIRKASSSEVPFNVDTALKSDLIRPSHSKVIDINDVVKKDAYHNKSKFTLHSRVAIGNADFKVMTTSNRQGR